MYGGTLGEKPPTRNYSPFSSKKSNRLLLSSETRSGRMPAAWLCPLGRRLLSRSKFPPFLPTHLTCPFCLATHSAPCNAIQPQEKICASVHPMKNTTACALCIKQLK